MWNMSGSFQEETHPERDNLNCHFLGDRCNYAPECSGVRNIGTSGHAILVRVKPCECCTCWYNIFNTKPVLSDDNYSTATSFKGIQIYRVPVTPWIFAHKIRVLVSQSSLTRNSFSFWKSIRNQQN